MGAYNWGNNVVRWTQRQMWKLVIDKYLKPKGWNLSAQLLSHSLQNHPSPKYFGKNSAMVKVIKKDSAFKNSIKAVLKKYGNKRISDTRPLRFKSGDLFGALHDCSLNVKGKKGSGKRKLDISITDTYDFKLQFNTYKTSMFATIGNNLAWTDQYSGAVKNYGIYINFSIR